MGSNDAAAISGAASLQHVLKGLSEFDGADFVWAQSEAVKTGMNLRGKLNELFKSADSVEGRVQADADGLLLEATWKGMRSLQKALAVVAENLARCKRPGGTLPPVCRFSVEDAFARELQSSVFADCLNIRATQCVQQCEEAMNNFAETAESHHSGQGWKGDLKEDASLQDVLTKAAITIGTLKGNTVKARLDELSQASGKCFISVNHYMFSLPDRLRRSSGSFTRSSRMSPMPSWTTRTSLLSSSGPRKSTRPGLSSPSKHSSVTRSQAM